MIRRLLRSLSRPAHPPSAAAPPRPPKAATAGNDDAARALRALTRQVHELRGLLHQQASFTMDALHRAGLQTDAEASQQAALDRTLRSIRGTGDVIVGPWTGEVGFELLYWIPFLGWLVEQGLDARRIVVVSRGGASPWYAHLSSRYVDILDVVTPEEFRVRTAGPKKQVEGRDTFDAELVTRVRQALRLSDSTPVVHPSSMYRLFGALWRKRATLGLVQSFTSHRALTAPAPGGQADLPAGLPPDYLVAKFYFSKAFPDNTANRRFVADLVRSVSAQAPLLVLSTAMRLDEHRDFQAGSGSGVFVLDAHALPQKNLEVQTRVICQSHGFIGTYGGFSYLAPFYGVRSLSFFSRRFGFESHHLDLANRVFDRLMPGGFLALDRRAIDLVSPSVARWLSEPRTTPGVPEDEPQDAEPERADVLT
jgi:hypothetical protein